MVDVVDVASEHAEYLLQRHLEQHQRRAAGQVASAEFCMDCDEPIPALRREKVAGCQTCVECQAVREARR